MQADTSWDLRGVGAGEVGGLNAHNKDLTKPIQGSIIPYPRPPYLSKVPLNIARITKAVSKLAGEQTCRPDSLTR